MAAVRVTDTARTELTTTGHLPLDSCRRAITAAFNQLCPWQRLFILENVSYSELDDGPEPGERLRVLVISRTSLHYHSPRLAMAASVL